MAACIIRIRLGGCTNKLQVVKTIIISGGEKSKVKALADSVFVRAHLRLPRQRLLAASSHRRGEGAPWGLFIRHEPRT